jgi:hypothetical protein
MTNSPAADTPTSAGMYDYYLGGTAYTAADRAAAERIVELMPEIPDGALANRGFLQRAVTRMARDWGIRQFIDIGAGLPTQRNTHDVVAEHIRDGRVVYVDVNASVVDRARQLLADVPGTAVIQADVRTPEVVFQHHETRRLIDLSAPVGLLLVAVLHFVPDDDDPWSLVERYTSALARGSYLALTHSALGDQVAGETVKATGEIYRSTATPWTDRSKTEIERFFTGTEIVPPYEGAGAELVFIGAWGADDPARADSEGSRLGYAAVGHKP